MPDPEGPRLYANVDNRLEFIDQHLRVANVALAVPTAFFTLAKDVLKITPEERVTLAVEYVDRWFLFSALTNTNRLFDLWLYTPATLPAWMRLTEYRIDAARNAYGRR